jgi:hypothetical protein
MLAVTVPALAVRVTVCALETGVTFAVNWALLAFVCTSAAGDVVTAALLLDRATLKPGASAGPLRDTVQTSVPVPTKDELAQEMPVSCGSPVPLRATAAVPLTEELLVMVNRPVAAPSAEGSNCMLSVADWPGFNVTGNVLDAMVKPAPVTVAPLTVTGPVPVEFMVTAWIASVFTATLPKATLAVLRLRVGTGTFSSSAKVSVTVPALAVKVTACALETGVTFAVNWALLAFVCTSAAGDIVTAALLLDKATLKPGARAGPLSATVQRSVPVPPMDALLQEIPVS